MRHKITKEFQEKVISYYKSSPMTISSVCEQFNICLPTAIKILKGVTKHSKTSIYNPQLNERFFDDVDTERKAYWVGLIIADGNVYNPVNSAHHGQKWVSITLQDGDVYLLNEFKKDTGVSTKISSDGRGSSYVAIRSTHMADALLKYGITERKSFDTHFPFSVDKTLYRHLIRGIIDGDGSIQAFSNKSQNGKIKFLHSISCCGTHNLMKEMVDVIDECIKLSHKPAVYDYKNRTLSEFRISSIEDMNKLGEWIYTDATIYMERKKYHFDLFKDHYGLNNP